MKKSFKVLLLAVMALCLYVTAAAAAANATLVSSGSFDIQLKLDLKPGLYNAADASNAVNVYYSSKDILCSMDVKTGKESADFGTPEVAQKYNLESFTTTSNNLAEIKLSFDYYVTNVSFDISEVVPPKGASMSVYWRAKSANTKRAEVETSAEVSATNQGETQTVDLGEPKDGASFDILVDLASASQGRVLQFVVTLVQSGDAPVVVAEPFDSADIKVYMNGTLIKTVTASADVDSADVYVDLGAKVSFDVVLSSDVLSVSEDGVALASKDNYYTLSKDFAASGDKAVVVIMFASGDPGTFKFTLNVIASGDSSSSGGETGEVTVDTDAEDVLENLDTITAANISSEDIVAAFEALGIDGELTIDTSTSFTLFNLVKDDGTIAAVGIPALNAAIALLTSGNKGSETIDATTALKTVSGSDLLAAITAFCADGWNTFVATVFKTSDMTEDNAKRIDESAASETGEDGAYKSFGVALDKKLPAGTILLFTLIDTDTDAQTYYAMVLPGAVNTEVSVIPFNVANLRAFDGSSTLGTSAPTIATSTYKIAYSTLDGGGADFSSASVLAAIKAAAVETGEAAYVGEYALTSTSDSSGSEEEPTDQVSSHGSSSGCDAGFGALALLAVAGALAARKVRK